MIIFVLGFGLGFVGATALMPENRAATIAWAKALPGRAMAWMRNLRG
jgi:hypothetical protein